MTSLRAGSTESNFWPSPASHAPLINGAWEAGEGQKFDSVDPARNEVIWSGESASANQVEKAVMAARQAFPEWAEKSVDERLAICKEF
ncbi:aldehyde dehydrogenase family protein, partial [Idiomarina zobellii]